MYHGHHGIGLALEGRNAVCGCPAWGQGRGRGNPVYVIWAGRLSGTGLGREDMDVSIVPIIWGMDFDDVRARSLRI